MRRISIIVIALLIGAYVLSDRVDWISQDTSQTDSTVSDPLRHAYENKLSKYWVTGHGKVKLLLKDDLKGSRHQRFIIGLPSGQTILIAHNIDLAPRIQTLQKGDRVEFSGMYEWNDKGGVVHWTHHDPDAKRAGGWLKHKGREYR